MMAWELNDPRKWYAIKQKPICPKGNVIPPLEFELVYDNFTVQHVNQYAMGTPSPQQKKTKKKKKKKKSGIKIKGTYASMLPQKSRTFPESFRTDNGKNRKIQERNLSKQTIK